MEKQQIHYLSSLPGVGKTHLAVKTMRKHLRGDKGIIIYVAPSRDLLKEVRKYLEKKLEPDQIKKIRTVISDSLHYQIPVRIRALLTGKALPDGTVLTKLKPGSVILMTHEGFLRLPDDLPFKNKTTVIFDEARKFTAQLKSMRLSNDKERELFHALISKNSTPLIGPNGVKTKFHRFSLSKWPDNLKDISNSVDGRKQYLILRNLVEAAMNVRTDVYVRLRNSNEAKYDFYEVTLPSRVFSGFRTVIIMAAFLEDSQMWYLLKNNPKIELVPLWKHPDFTWVEHAFDDKVRQIKDRFSRVAIFPLTEQTRTLSSTQMEKGIMVPANQFNSIREQLEELKIPNLVILRAFKEQHILREPNENEKKAIKLLAKHKVKWNPFKWYMKAAVKFVHSLRDSYMIEDKVLVVVNNRYRNFVSENFEDLELISPTSHGLNKYSNSNTLVFIMAIHPKPKVVELYRALLKDYDFAKDHIADSCVQAVTRLCVRDVKSETIAYVILPDMAMAYLLRSKMLDRPTISSRAIDKLNRIALVNLSAKKRVRRLNVKNVSDKDRKKAYDQKWRSDPINRKLASLRATKSRYKKKYLEAGINLPPKIEAHIKEIDKEIRKLLDQKD